MNTQNQMKNEYESEEGTSECSQTAHNNNHIVKETIKIIKVYIPADGYDHKLSFEQNLAENKVKLAQEMPANVFMDDPLNECLTLPLLQNGTLSPELNKVSESSFKQEEYKEPSILKKSDDSSKNIYCQEVVKQHFCDVCKKIFKHRRDLALHYLLHTEKEKRRAAKKVPKCDICNNILQLCHCKNILNKIYPTFNNMPNSLSFSEPVNSSTFFLVAESVSGNRSVIKRNLFHCPECELPFGLDSQLKQHLLSHKRERAKMEKQKKLLFSCNLCEEKFSDENSLTFHNSSVHSDNLNLI